MKIKGLGVSSGKSAGKVVKLSRPPCSGEEPALPLYAEKKKLENALEVFKGEILRSAGSANGSKAQRDILFGMLTVLNDDLMKKRMFALIEMKKSASAAVTAACNEVGRIFACAEDEIIRQRADDIEDIKHSLLNIIGGSGECDFAEFEKGSVAVSKHIAVSDVCRMKPENVYAVVSSDGGMTGHSAILLREKGIPAVFCAKGIFELVHDGDLIFVDGTNGEVDTSPAQSKTKRYANKNTCIFKKEKSITLPGEYSVHANISGAAGAEEAFCGGADGIGLFRTEFLFCSKIPNENEQFLEYSAAAKAASGKPLVIRTLDISDDKKFAPLPGMKRRAICDKALFKTQIKAILRAARFCDVKILLAYVRSLDELLEARKIISICKKELKNEKILYKNAPLGVMIETAKAVEIIDSLAAEADFLSIGTNDLTAQITGIERRHITLDDTMKAEVLNAIKTVVLQARKNIKNVTVCGEAAADEKALNSFLNIGIKSFSVSPKAVPEVKNIILRSIK